jgi:hypothetical protein
LYDSARDQVRPLTTNALYKRLPFSHHIVRIYAKSNQYAGNFAAAIDGLFGVSGSDDLTNM